MDIKKSLEIIEADDKFKQWQSENGHSFLAHVFVMFGKNESIQFGYYNEETDKITTFVVENDVLTISEESEIFKKPEAKLQELDVDKVKITLDESNKIMTEFQAEKYPNEKPVNAFVILQNIDEGQVFNYTYVTQGFNTLNVKIDAESGEVINHNLSSLMDMGEIQKGE